MACEKGGCAANPVPWVCRGYGGNVHLQDCGNLVLLAEHHWSRRGVLERNVTMHFGSCCHCVVAAGLRRLIKASGYPTCDFGWDK